MYTIIFGWGKKQKHWKTPDGKNLVVTWNYFNILWCPIGFNIKWHLVEDEKIVVELNGDVGPCVIRSEYDRGFLTVIMPMRI